MEIKREADGRWCVDGVIDLRGQHWPTLNGAVDAIEAAVGAIEFPPGLPSNELAARIFVERFAKKKCLSLNSEEITKFSQILAASVED